MLFDILVIDPPWPHRKGGNRKVRPNQGRDMDYSVMAVADIFELLDIDVFSCTALQHCVFIWTIDKFLQVCEQQMEMRGYRRHARFIWDKGSGIAPAFTIRYSHEYLLWYYKPKLLPIAKSARGIFATVIQARPREHSRKPNEAYDMIEVLYPNAMRIDVFSREKRAGWMQYGNEVKHFEYNGQFEVVEIGGGDVRPLMGKEE